VAEDTPEIKNDTTRNMNVG